MTNPIINIDDVELRPTPPEFAPTGDAANRFGARMGRVSQQIGAVQLGYNITSLPPGMRAFPFHNHRVNEEMFLVLDGSGEIRIGDEVYPIRRHDFIACPAGGPGTAHQIVNTSDKELTYLAVSTNRSPELAEYPDSGKFAVLGMFSDAETPRLFRYVGREAESLDYWEGE